MTNFTNEELEVLRPFGPTIAKVRIPQDLIDKLTRRKTNKFINEELVYKYYEQVSEEIQSGFKEDGVWAKAFSISDGDEQKTKQNTSN